MRLNVSEKSLPVYEAMASPVRLKILQLISEQPRCITELADSLNLSKAIITRHIQKLEDAHLIKYVQLATDDKRKKYFQMAVDSIYIDFPLKIFSSYSVHRKEIGVGNYSNFYVEPTCGMCSSKKKIGSFDDPTAFVSPDRIYASLLWFSSGFVEYKIPSNLSPKEVPKMLEISMELGSEFPFSNNVWSSDIDFFVNGVALGSWLCPGDYSDTRGFYTPSWWDDDCSQYGILKHIRVGEDQTSADGQYMSNVTINQLHLTDSPFTTLRIESNKEKKNCGGVTIFGKYFGNYPQDIVLSTYYC